MQRLGSTLYNVQPAELNQQVERRKESAFPKNPELVIAFLLEQGKQGMNHDIEPQFLLLGCSCDVAAMLV